MSEKVYALIDALFPTEKSKRAALYEFASQATDMRDRIKELEDIIKRAIDEYWDMGSGDMDHYNASGMLEVLQEHRPSAPSPAAGASEAGEAGEGE